MIRLLSIALVAAALTADFALAEWRIEVYGGWFLPQRSDLTIERPLAGDDITYHQLDWEDKSFESPIYYGVRFCRFFEADPRFGAELELVHSKVHADPDDTPRAEGLLNGTQVDREMRLGDHVQQFNISHGANLVLANMVYRRGFTADGDFDRDGPYLTLRLGAGAAVAHTESTIEDIHRGRYELGGFALQGALGAVLPVWDRIYLPVEYKYSTAWLSGLDVDGGSAETTVRGSHIALGAGVRF